MVASTLRRLSLILALFCLSGCAREGAARGPRAPARELPTDVGALLARSGQQYGGPVVATGTLDPALRRAFEGRVPDGVRATLRHDPGLDLVAQVLAALYVRTEQVPAVSLEQWVFWRCGVTAIPAGFDILGFIGDAPGPQLDARLAQVAARQRARKIPLSYGLVRVAFREDVVVQALVLAGRPVEVPAFKKSFAPGEEMTLAVRPTLGYTNITLYADAGGGDVRVVPMTAADDQSFYAKVPLPSQPGRYFVQVAGTEPVADAVDPDHPWRHSLVLLPVYVGVPEPTEPDDFIRHPVPNPPDLAAWRDLILRTYNAERARLGLAPLALDPRAESVAQRRSAEVASTDEPRPDPHVYEELAAAGLPVNDLGDSLGYLEYVSEYVHTRLMEPAARHHLLSPATTLLGVGLTQRAGNDQVRPWAVIEYAIEPVGPLDTAKERDRVYAELGALDQAEQRPPITRDDALGRVAQGAAEEVCKGARRPEDAGKGLWDRARSIAAGNTKGGSFSWMGYRFTKAEIARVREGAKGRGYTRVGVGMCQGDMEGRPKSTFVLMMEMGP